MDTLAKLEALHAAVLLGDNLKVTLAKGELAPVLRVVLSSGPHLDLDPEPVVKLWLDMLLHKPERTRRDSALIWARVVPTSIARRYDLAEDSAGTYGEAHHVPIAITRCVVVVPYARRYLDTMATPRMHELE